MDMLIIMAVLALFSEGDVSNQTDDELLQKILKNEKLAREKQNHEQILRQRKQKFFENQQQQQQHLEFLMFLQRTWEQQQNDERWQRELNEIIEFWQNYWQEIEQHAQEEKLRDFLRWLEDALENADIISSRMKL
ncbi:hypothetical protein JBF11_01220 [Taurinivorans muris]|uniref:Uncharacterized protein n=1 Tax=Taurinivorans muris TaxID=2787751 RepID=A0ABY5Y1B5_9BACT|nr:hypothetical protein JBF11_01220 [Desulfovibrionaceae bacterium LT0009]